MRADSPKSRPYALRFMTRILALAVALTAVAAAPAEAAELPVFVVPELEFADLEALSQRGAVGLLVPDAGPETSAARSLAALERGAVRNSLLGDDPPGDPQIEVRVARSPPPGPAIVLGLPRDGTQANDRRYPIAVLGPGYRGLLTSPSTHIPGLVSVVDIAPTALDREGALGSAADADPVAALAELDALIRDHRDARIPVLLVSLALIVALAAFVPTAVLPGFAAILLANLVLGIAGANDTWIDLSVIVGFVAASLVFVRLPLAAHGLLLAGVLAAYLVAMGVDEPWVALSPFGPSQNARFHGLSSLLATLLLVPALAGAVLLGRAFGLWAFGAVAALALVTVGGSELGADSGGVIVLLAGYAALIVPFYGPTGRRAIAGVAVAVVLGFVLAVEGPIDLAEDLWRRLRLSWHIATDGWGVGLLVGAGVAALAVLALRERRPLLTAFLVALAVSLLVTGEPDDVIVAGLAGYLALSSAPGVARPAAERVTSAARGRQAQSAPATTP
jgi:hypothetical protein